MEGKGLRGCRLLATDLDGTILSARSRIEPASLDAMHRCGARGIIRVAVTGRTLYSARRVLDTHAPFDFLIFSSGLGTASWPDGRVLQHGGLPPTLAQGITRFLMREDFSFMAHLPVPGNHHFLYHRGTFARGYDFESRVHAYAHCAAPLPRHGMNFPEGLAQFVITLRPAPRILSQLRATLQRHASVVRATSPLDHRSVWLEVLPPDVNKGEALAQLAAQLNVEPHQVVVVGNDYNDLEMLERFEASYVVRNAPTVLLRRFRPLPDHNHDPLAALISSMGV